MNNQEKKNRIGEPQQSEGDVKLVLASGSPRRRELLGQLGLPFEIIVSHEDETTTETAPDRLVEELSYRKAANVAEHLPSAYSGATAVVIGSDTVVAVDGRILGKPEDVEDAKQMLQSLAGRSHQVYTGVTLLRKSAEGTERVIFHVKTDVVVYSMTTEEIEAYVATGEPMDKAGAYGIQGLFGKHIEMIRGDYTNVVGLPVGRLYQELRNTGWIKQWQ